MQQQYAPAASPRPLSGAPALLAKARPAMLFIVLPDLSEEDQMLTAARQGSTSALTQIYDAYFKPVYGFIRLRVDDAALAEDLSSEVFVRLVEAMRRRSGPRTSLRGWLFEVARNQVNDHYRSSKGFTEQALEDWQPDTRSAEMEVLAIRAATSEQTRRALRSLSSDQQEVLILRFAQKSELTGNCRADG